MQGIVPGALDMGRPYLVGGSTLCIANVEHDIAHLHERAALLRQESVVRCCSTEAKQIHPS